MAEHNVEFVSYDGEWPNLCRGVLRLKVDGREFEFPSYALCSGGSVHFDEDWNESVSSGPWSVNEWPADFPDSAKLQALEVINENVEHGCCGGCV